MIIYKTFHEIRNRSKSKPDGGQIKDYNFCNETMHRTTTWYVGASDDLLDKHYVEVLRRVK